MTNSWVGPDFANFGTEGDVMDSNWSQNEVPTSVQDAVINTDPTGAVITAGSNEDVGSISLGSDDILVIQNGAVFEDQNGTGPNVNDGAITVKDAALALGNSLSTETFDNGSTGAIELSSTSSSAVGILDFAGSINLTGSGVIEMTIGGTPVDNRIESESAAPATVVNASETISGTGTIGVGKLNFTNGTDGTIETNNSTSSSGGVLDIDGSANGGSFTNYGLVEAQNSGTVVLGEDGQTATIVNNETLELYSTSAITKFEIAGNVTISGTAGDFDTIALTGASNLAADELDWISSDGNAATLTLVNETLKGAGTVGDANLTLDNQSGTIVADDAGYALVLSTGTNTGTNTILNGGTLEAANGGFLDANDSIDNTGTINATGGAVAIFGSVTGAGAVDVGQGGSLAVLNGSVSDNLTFTGTDARLIIADGSGIQGAVVGAVSGDSILFNDVSYSASVQAVWTQTSSSGGTLSLVQGGSTLTSISLAGQYTNGEFGIASATRQYQGSGPAVQVNIPNPLPPSGTSADMIMRDGSNGDYEIYDLGNNGIMAAYALGQVGTAWQVAGLGGFDGTDTSDMILRNSSTGAFELYDVSNNNIANFTSMGQVGLAWVVSGFGDFSGIPGETDMLMQNTGNGDFEVYDISNNTITFASGMGQVGLAWTVAGFGDFSGNAGETGDMLMRNASTGQFEVYDISNNAITFATGMGQVGLEWSVAGFGDFSGNANETDMLMRNSNTGAFELYDISNNAITFAGPMGQVGLEWSVVGFGPIDGTGTSDMLMRNTNTGAFEIFDIGNNQLTNAAPMGQVGNEWSVAGIAADPPGGSAPANAQLVQAMASMGTSAPISAANTAPIGSETSVQTPLTMPQPG